MLSAFGVEDGRLSKADNREPWSVGAGAATGAALGGFAGSGMFNDGAFEYAAARKAHRVARAAGGHGWNPVPTGRHLAVARDTLARGGKRIAAGATLFGLGGAGVQAYKRRHIGKADTPQPTWRKAPDRSQRTVGQEARRGAAIGAAVGLGGLGGSAYDFKEARKYGATNRANAASATVLADEATGKAREARNRVTSLYGPDGRDSSGMWGRREANKQHVESAHRWDRQADYNHMEAHLSGIRAKNAVHSQKVILRRAGGRMAATTAGLAAAGAGFQAYRRRNIGKAEQQPHQGRRKVLVGLAGAGAAGTGAVIGATGGAIGGGMIGVRTAGYKLTGRSSKEAWAPGTKLARHATRGIKVGTGAGAIGGAAAGAGGLAAYVRSRRRKK